MKYNTSYWNLQSSFLKYFNAQRCYLIAKVLIISEFHPGQFDTKSSKKKQFLNAIRKEKLSVGVKPLNDLSSDTKVTIKVRRISDVFEDKIGRASTF